MTIEYRPIKREDYEAVRQFLSDSGWQTRVQDPVRFRTMMERADRTVVVLENSRVIGFGRALCDDVSNGYVSMVAVATDKRGQGIGTELVRRLIAEGKDQNVTWVLRAGRNSGGFWKKLGFTESEIAMERVRHSQRHGASTGDSGAFAVTECSNDARTGPHRHPDKGMHAVFRVLGRA